MTFETKGFLSPDVEEWRGGFVVQNAKWFELAHDLNTLAHSLAFSSTLKNSDRPRIRTY
jgi:hypothetical protein